MENDNTFYRICPGYLSYTQDARTEYIYMDTMPNTADASRLGLSAVSRATVSLVQPGGARRNVPGSSTQL